MTTVIGLFRSTYEVDKAVNHLLSHRFQGTQIRVVTMRETRFAPLPRKGLLGWLMRGGVLGDTIDRSDGTSVMDGTVAGATIGGLAGVILGSTLLPGPVALGVAGIMGGGLIGYLLDRMVPEIRRLEYDKALDMGATLVLVRCRTPQETDTAEHLLQENQAHEVGRIP